MESFLVVADVGAEADNDIFENLDPGRNGGEKVAVDFDLQFRVFFINLFCHIVLENKVLGRTEAFIGVFKNTAVRERDRFVTFGAVTN